MVTPRLKTTGLSQLALGLKVARIKPGDQSKTVLVDNIRITRDGGEFVATWVHTSNWRQEPAVGGDVSSKLQQQIGERNVTYPAVTAEGWYQGKLEVSADGAISVRVLELTPTPAFIASRTTVPVRDEAAPTVTA